MITLFHTSNLVDDMTANVPSADRVGGMHHTGVQRGGLGK